MWRSGRRRLLSCHLRIDQRFASRANKSFSTFGVRDLVQTYYNWLSLFKRTRWRCSLILLEKSKGVTGGSVGSLYWLAGSGWVHSSQPCRMLTLKIDGAHLVQALSQWGASHPTLTAPSYEFIAFCWVWWRDRKVISDLTRQAFGMPLRLHFRIQYLEEPMELRRSWSSKGF